MAYKSIWLQDFRSYKDYTVELSPGVTIIVGPNGSGKTNLLEALYVLSQGTSFRVSDKDLVRYEKEYFRIEGQYDDQKRVLLLNPTDQPAKQFNIDGIKKHRLTHPQKVPVVLFEPDELRLLSGSPARRRDYLDSLLARLWPDAARAKSRFERALLQRNNVLKQAPQFSSLDDQLFVWNIKMAEYAEQVLGYRMKLIGYANEVIGQLYSSLAHRESQVTLSYKSSTKATKDYKTHLLHELNSRLQLDMQRGYTSAGPHRDDFAVSLNNIDASLSASRGEIRTLVLALKMIELQLLHQHTGRPPLLLLDDVFSELDSTRRQALANFARDYQTVITTTDADLAKGMQNDELKIIIAELSQSPDKL